MTAAATATSPRPRSPAQIEAARRNGARSKGPVTAEGKARSARNALKHGLSAIKHLVLDDEDETELEALTRSLMDEIGPTSEVEGRIVQRLAAAFWKGERAERLEAALFAAAPTMRPPLLGGTWEEADPLATFDLARFNAIRLYQAQQGREVSRCLKELRQLRREPLATEADEPEPAPVQPEPQNEPEAPAEPPPLAAQAPLPPSPSPLAPLQNEPGKPARVDLPFPQPRHPVPLPGLGDAAARGTMVEARVLAQVETRSTPPLRPTPFSP
jgi:hypothetical protein